jgi:alanine dehydrogenase
MPLILNEHDVRSVLPMDDLIATMEKAVSHFSAGAVQQPVRTVLPAASGGFFGVMPAYLSEPSALGAKLVTLYTSNTAKNIPTHLATIVVLDPETGRLQAIMDGRFITEARTAAVSAVTARHLALPQASTLAIIGSGVQARSHIEALPLVRPVKEVRAWSPTRAHLEQFVNETSPHVSATVRACQSAEEAVRGADLIVLATSSVTPVVQAAWVTPGAHVMCVGACRPNQREMDPELVSQSRFFVDSKAAALVESGDVIISIAEGRFTAKHIQAEIGEVILGRAPGRRTSDEITVFKSLGMAVEDVASGELAYRRALQRGVGKEVTI